MNAYIGWFLSVCRYFLTVVGFVLMDLMDLHVYGAELVGLIWISILIHLCNCSSGEPGSAGRPTRHSAIYNRNGVVLHCFSIYLLRHFFIISLPGSQWNGHQVLERKDISGLTEVPGVTKMTRVLFRCPSS